MQGAAQAIPDDGPNPPSFLFVSAGSKEGAGTLENTMPDWLLPGYVGRPDMVAVYAEPGAIMLNPGVEPVVNDAKRIRIVIIEVAVTRELTLDGDGAW